VQRDVDLLLSICAVRERLVRRARHDPGPSTSGHPLTGEVRARYGRAEFCRRHDLDPARPLVTYYPEAVTRSSFAILPPMLDAAL